MLTLWKINLNDGAAVIHPPLHSHHQCHLPIKVRRIFLKFSLTTELNFTELYEKTPMGLKINATSKNLYREKMSPINYVIVWLLRDM